MRLPVAESVNMSKQEILSKVDDFLNVNGINTLQKTDFSYEAAKEVIRRLKC